MKVDWLHRRLGCVDDQNGSRFKADRQTSLQNADPSFYRLLETLPAPASSSLLAPVYVCTCWSTDRRS